MCLRNPACQDCATCGRRKYQFWIDSEMHDAGCPFGAQTAAGCKESRENAGYLQWARDNGVTLQPSALMFLDMMERQNAVDRSDKSGRDHARRNGRVG